MSKSEIQHILQDLTETARAGAEGFRLAAEAVEDSDLRDVLSNLSGQRESFVSELQGLSSELFDEPTTDRDSDTVTASIHRGLINLKSVLSSRNDAAVLAECRRGEERANESYDDAISIPLPDDVLNVIRPQAEAVRSSLEQISRIAALTSA